MPESVSMKKCSKCGKEFPATNDYFCNQKSRKDGLFPNCNACRKIYNRNNSKKNQEDQQIRVKQRQMLYQKEHSTYFCKKCNRELPLTEEFFLKRKTTKSGFSIYCKQCISYISKSESIKDGNIPTRKCTKCHSLLPATSEFFGVSVNKIGLSPKCKKCAVKMLNEYKRNEPLISSYLDQKNRSRHWNKEDVEYLISNYGRGNNKNIAQKLGRSLRSVQAKYKQLGLSTRRKVPLKAIEVHRKCRYGIEPEQYNQMLEDQKGCCAICGKHQDNFDRNLYVDHDHITDKIRGLLCHNCNAGLGMFQSDTNGVETLLKAIEYIQKQSEKSIPSYEGDYGKKKEVA